MQEVRGSNPRASTTLRSLLIGERRPPRRRPVGTKPGRFRSRQTAANFALEGLNKRGKAPRDAFPFFRCVYDYLHLARLARSDGVQPGRAAHHYPGGRSARSGLATRNVRRTARPINRIDPSARSGTLTIQAARPSPSDTMTATTQVRTRSVRFLPLGDQAGARGRPGARLARAAVRRSGLTLGRGASRRSTRAGTACAPGCAAARARASRASAAVPVAGARGGLGAAGASGACGAGGATGIPLARVSSAATACFVSGVGGPYDGGEDGEGDGAGVGAGLGGRAMTAPGANARNGGRAPSSAATI